MYTIYKPGENIGSEIEKATGLTQDHFTRLTPVPISTSEYPCDLYGERKVDVGEGN